MHGGPSTPFRVSVAAVALLALGPASAAEERFPELRPANRVQALSALTGGAELPVPCLTPMLESLRLDPSRATRPARRALALLEAGTLLTGETRTTGPDGTLVRYTLDGGSFDRIAASDRDGDGLPDIVHEALAGLDDARRVLVDGLGLPAPGPLEVLLADLAGLDGYALAGAGNDGRTLLVLNANPEPGADSVRRASAHQYAHAVARSLPGSLPSRWGEALAQWTVARILGGPDSGLRPLLAARIERLDEGLLADDLALAAGNALWLSFLEEAHGAETLRPVLEDLASGDPEPAALDHGLRRSAGVGLEAALREFHLWSVLVGERADGRHFSFARQVDATPFASTAEGMPELSVQSDPPVSALGATGVLIRPQDSDGGITVLFEGEISGRWQADLLIRSGDGALHRISMPVVEGRAEVTVPLDRVDEAMLLVRSLSFDDARPQRYTWSVHRERGFPFELGALEATYSESSGGVLVSWETLSEQRLAGFNVLRTSEDSGETVRVNPVWVPAFGDVARSFSYQFVDATAEPGAAYVYRVEGVTTEGLTSRSRAVALAGGPSTR